jgi:hypothetical protein
MRSGIWEMPMTDHELPSNVRQLRRCADGDKPAEDHPAHKAVAEAAAQACDILADISGHLQHLTALLRLLAADADFNSAVLLSTIASDLDLIRHGLPTAITAATESSPDRKGDFNDLE